MQLAPNQFRAFASILDIENASVEGRYECILHIDSEPFLFEFLIVRSRFRIPLPILRIR